MAQNKTTTDALEEARVGRNGAGYVNDKNIGICLSVGPNVSGKKLKKIREAQRIKNLTSTQN